MPNIMLVGDIIVDEYVATEPLGISAEAPVIVVKEIDTKKYLGGAGVIEKTFAFARCQGYIDKRNWE